MVKLSALTQNVIQKKNNNKNETQRVTEMWSGKENFIFLQSCNWQVVRAHILDGWFTIWCR